MVMVEDTKGCKQDLTDKKDIKAAIMKANEKKFCQSTHRPFYNQPLVGYFGFKAISPSSSAVLAGIYESNDTLPASEQQLLQALETLQEIRDLQPIRMDLKYEEYVGFWRKAQENTSSYPDALSFSTMKAGTTSTLISEIEWRLIKMVIPPLGGGTSWIL